MRVCHIVYGLSFGGIGTMLVHIANEQVKSNEVSILIVSTIVDPSRINALDPRIRVKLLNRKAKSLNPMTYIMLNLYIWKCIATSCVFHFHDGTIKKYVLPSLWKRIKDRSCVTLHGYYSIETIHKKKIKDFSFRYAISQAVSDVIFERSGLDSFVIHNGIKAKNFTQREKNTDDGVFRIVQISRLDHEKKGHLILLEAVKNVVSLQPEIKLQVDLIGSGPSHDVIKKKIEEYGLDKVVTMLGNKTQDFLYHNLHTYDLLVQPSINEGFGLTVAEAMYCKVPVLVSSAQGPEEITDYGKYGLVFENGNAVDCARKIILQALGKSNIDLDAGAVHILKKYSVDRVADQYLQQYASILKAGGF